MLIRITYGVVTLRALNVLNKDNLSLCSSFLVHFFFLLSSRFTRYQRPITIITLRNANLGGNDAIVQGRELLDDSKSVGEYEREKRIASGWLITNIAMLEILTCTLITNRAILDQRQYMRARGPMKIERARNCKKRVDLAIYRGPLITGRPGR